MLPHVKTETQKERNGKIPFSNDRLLRMSLNRLESTFFFTIYPENETNANERIHEDPFFIIQ